jgi:hypothetical protein
MQRGNGSGNRRQVAMFGGGFDADPFSRMDEMMGGSISGAFGDGFFAGGGGNGGRRRGGGDGGRQGGGGGGDLGFGRVERMMNDMLSGAAIMPGGMMAPLSGGAFGEGFGDGHGGAFFSSSSSMSFSSGDGQTRQYSSQTTSHRGGPGGDRVSETKSQYRDSSGVEKAAWERSLNDRARMTIKQRNRNASGEVSTRERYHHVDERNAEQFDREFGHAAQHVRRLQQDQRRLASGPGNGHGGPAIYESERRPLMGNVSGRLGGDGGDVSRRNPRNGMAALTSFHDGGGGGDDGYANPGSSRRGSRASSSASWQDNHLGNID